MACARCILFAVGSLLVLLTGVVHGAEDSPPHADLYGDPLPPGAVVRLLSTDTLKEKSRLTASAGGAREYVRQLVFSPDGRRLAASWGTVKHHPMEASFTFDIPHDVLIWDLAGAKAPRCLPAFNEVPLRFAPDCNTLLCRNECEMRLYDAASGHRLHNRPGHGCVGLALAVSLDGKILASGDNDGILHLWDAATSKHQWKSESRDLHISDCLFSADGKGVAAGNLGGPFFDIHTWEVANGNRLGRISVHREHGCLYAAALSADGKRFMGVYTKEANSPPAELVLWDVATGKRLSQKPYRMKIDADSNGTIGSALAAFSADGARLTVWSDDRLGIEEVSTGSLLARLPKGVGCPSVFTPPGHLLMVMIRPSKEDGPDGEGVEIWSMIEAASGEEIVRLELKAPNKISFTPDGRNLVVSRHKNLCVLDAETGERLHQMAWPTSIAGMQDWLGYPYVPTLVALPGDRVAASMAEGDIVVWDLQPSRWPKRKPKHELDRKELESLWSDLALDAHRAYRAMHKLTASPAQTIAFLRELFRPPDDGKRIEKLLADLDNDSFRTREAASHELKRMPYRAEPMMRLALQNKPSLEVRRRIEPILSAPRFPSAEDLRALRTIAVLERIGTPEARRLLEKVVCCPMSPEIREAKAALNRLKYR